MRPACYDFNIMVTQKVISYIKKHALIPAQSTIVVGLSGGPDSMLLLHMLASIEHEHPFTLVAAHLDHEWRTNSQEDVKFCQNVTDALGVPLVVGKASLISLEKKFNGSQEEFGRHLRRHFLQTVAREHSASAIALGHHAQDQQETFFIRLLRGSSLSGLVGMRPKHGLYIRPLLCLTRDEIVTWLAAHNLPYLSDPTNSSDHFLRNRIRNHVIPALHAADKRFAHNLEALRERLQSADEALDELAQHFVTTHTNSAGMHTTSLGTLPRELRYRVLLYWLCNSGVPFTPTQALLDEIMRFFMHERGGIHAVHPDWAIAKKKGRVHIIRQQPKP